MNSIDELYDKNYYGSRMDFKEKVYPEISKALTTILNPCNVVDVGCGNGVLSKGFSCKYMGIEGSKEGVGATEARGLRVFWFDLREELLFETLTGNKNDLAVSIEVAEHLEPEYADIFVGNLCELSNTIVLTASNVNDGGKYHFNPQPKSYWIEKFTAKGYKYKEDLTTEITSIMKSNINTAYAYLWNNMMVFTNER